MPPLSPRNNHINAHGNVLFLILIAVALFAGLGYAVTTSLNTAPAKVEDEKQKLDQAVLNNCEAAINLALLRLRNMGDCSDDEINYEMPDGSNANPNAPADDHCNVFHPAYGGASPCGLDTDPACDLTTLSIGESCSGIVYAGESGGNRIYTSRADHGTTSWNDGSTNYDNTPADSFSDGLANTDALLAFTTGTDYPYQAATRCRALGEKWYLPARDELNLLYTNRAAIGGFNESDTWPVSHYWTSSEWTDNTLYAWRINFGDGSIAGNARLHSSLVYRCVRRD